MPTRSDDDDPGEVAILRGSAARRFLEGLGSSGGGGDDEDEEWEDDDGVVWVKKPEKPARKPATRKPAAKKSGGFKFFGD